MANAAGAKGGFPEGGRMIRISLFGPLRIENQYGVIEENLHRQVGYWQLLKFLLLTPLRAVSEEEALERIWVDEFKEEDILSARVRVTRLRKALAPLHLDALRDGLILSGQGQFLLNPAYELEMDVQRFDALMERIMAADARDGEGLRLCEQALQLFRGRFMANTAETDWVRPYRQKYRAAFEQLAGETLRRMRALGDDQPLALLCRRSASIVPEAQELHSEILRYLEENGKELQKLRHEFQLSGFSGQRMTDAQQQKSK